MPTTARFTLSLDGFLTGPDGRPATAAESTQKARTLPDLDAVDKLEVLLVPVLLGDGLPFTIDDGNPRDLRLTDTKAYPDGVVGLSYEFA
jgi:dihydrofolate reductase